MKAIKIFGLIEIFLGAAFAITGILIKETNAVIAGIALMIFGKIDMHD